MTSLRSSITGAEFEFDIVDVTEIVVDDPDVEVCNLAGNGFPGTFLLGAFEADFGLTIFDDRLVIFAAGFFANFLAIVFFAAEALVDFFAPLILRFLAIAFLPLTGDFLNNFLIATIPPEVAKIMAWPMYLPTATPAAKYGVLRNHILRVRIQGEHESKARNK